MRDSIRSDAAISGQRIRIAAIRYPGERASFVVLLLAALVTVAVFVAITATEPAVGGVILFYVVLFVGVSWLTKILAMAEIRGNGIRVSDGQYPQLHAYVCRFAAALELTKVPDVYVVQATVMNAFATKVIGKRYVVLYSHLVDAALESGDNDEVAMIIGHELAHHAGGHVRWAGFLCLGFWIPFLHFYWSRRTEYTRDRAGLLLVNKLQPSLQGMVKLAVGRKLAASTNLAAVRQQRKKVSRELGPTIVEIFSSHPLTIKRLTEIEDFAQGRVPS
jgi:Zn-dependent protease with chaperone function